MAITLRSTSANITRPKAHLVAQAELLGMELSALERFVRETATRNPFLQLSPQASLLGDIHDHEASASLWSELENFVATSFPHQQLREIAEACLVLLDEAGRLPEKTTEQLVQRGHDRRQVVEVIKRLQEFGPPGIFGQGMADQYRLQLLAVGFRAKDLPLKLLQHWQDLLVKGLEPVAAKLGKDVLACRDALEVLVRHGHPISMNEHLEKNTPPEIEILGVQPPHFKCLHDVSKLLEFDQELWVKLRQEGVGKDLLDAKREADKLLAYLSERHRVMVDVLNFMLQHQQRHLLDPRIPVLPMTMVQLSDKIGVACSTISRLAGHLVMTFSGRTIALRSLFALPMGQDAPLTAQGLMHELQREVGLENWPLSDHQLATAICVEGWSPSVSSVGKYRRLAGIPDVRARRAWVRYLPREPRYWLDAFRMV